MCLVTLLLSDNYLYGKSVDPNKTKELKVKLPVSVHMRLHGMKILGDKSISATVAEALDDYFAQMDADRVDGDQHPNNAV